MSLKNISIKNFRNLCQLKLELGAGLNVLVGENGQGKSNFLEAVYYLANGKSFRGALREHLVREGEDGAILSADLLSEGLEFFIDLEIYGQERNLKLCGKSQHHWSKIRELFQVLVFTPDSTQLFRISPSVRRNYWDAALALQYPTVGTRLSDYQKVVRSRNRLLESGAPVSLCEPFDRQWAQLAFEIHQARIQYLEDLLPYWRKRLLEILRGNLDLQAQWVGTLASQPHSSPEWYGEILLRFRHEERRRCQTLVGPHREDLRVTLGGKGVKETASQGQQRLLVIALKLAEADLFLRHRGTPPLFLLDDLGSELDPGHLSLLLNTLGELRAQTLLTTSLGDSFKQLPARIFRVREGNIEELFHS